MSTTLDVRMVPRTPPAQQRPRPFEAGMDAGVRYGGHLRLEPPAPDAPNTTNLVQLEARYAADGRITTTERSDLATRYRALSQRLAVPAAKDDDYGQGDWRPLSEMRASFEDRLNAQVRNRNLTRTQASRLSHRFHRPRPAGNHLPAQRPRQARTRGPRDPAGRPEPPRRRRL